MKLPQYTIAVDMDDVLAQWAERFVEWYNYDVPHAKISFDTLDIWRLEETVGHEAVLRMRSYLRYPNFYQDLEPVPGAIDGMKELIADGHDVLIVTSIPKFAGLAYEGKQQWIRKHMPFFDLDNFLAVRRKDKVEADFLLDDAPHNIEAFRKKPNARGAFVFDRPWNRKIEPGFRCRRVDSWPDFVRKIRRTQRLEQVTALRKEEIDEL